MTEKYRFKDGWSIFFREHCTRRKGGRPFAFPTPAKFAFGGSRLGQPLPGTETRMRSHAINPCANVCRVTESVFTFCTETLETPRQGKLPRLLSFVNGAMHVCRTRRLCNCRLIRR